MKFNCGMTRDAKRAIKHNRLENWHKKFAWLPIRAGENDCRWLEFYDRKGTFNTGRYEYSFNGYWSWEYRFKD